MAAHRSLPRLSGAEERALINTDLVTGTTTARCNVRDDLVRKGLIYRAGNELCLTSLGFDVRRVLMRSAQVFNVCGLPFEKVCQITDYYLAGMDLGEISRRMRVRVGDVEEALRFRGVLVG